MGDGNFCRLQPGLSNHHSVEQGLIIAAGSGKCCLPVRPDWFPQLGHLLRASSWSHPSPLGSREARLLSDLVNHIPSLVQVEIVNVKCWTGKDQAGKLRISTNTVQSVYPPCDNGASPSSLAAAYQASMLEACREKV